MNKKKIIATALALVAPIAASAQSVDLTITGTIIPNACTPTLSGGASIDLGRISSGALNEDIPTPLPESEEVTLTFSCDAATAVAISPTDNRNPTIVNSIALPGNITSGLYKFGLGAGGGANIGILGLIAGTPTVDGTDQNRIWKQYMGGNWNSVAAGVGGPYLARASHNSYVYTSWGVDAATGPASGLIHTLPLRAQAVIRPAKDLDLTGEVAIDGSVTFNVIYL